MTLTIEEFWIPRLGARATLDVPLVKGWAYQREGLATFREAPLSLNTEISSADEEKSRDIILVSAPGAVGKSTLAKQIAFATGAVYIDLAQTDPVGGNTLSGGLAKSKLFELWEAGQIAVLIDGLDEARFRVTQEAFEAFLSDVAILTRGRTVPTVLFGRTGAIQDTWLAFEVNNTKSAVVEIGYYGPEDSIDFAEAQLRSLRPKTQHTNIERDAIRALLQKLRAQTETDGDRFAGYAPVLKAVAERVADVGNPAALISEIEKSERPVTLQTVVTAILDRERSKLNTLQFEDGSLTKNLYSAGEQLDRLVARIYGHKPPSSPSMSAKDNQTYSNALETWVPDHPFLDGGKGASSAVFEAVLATRALKSKAAGDLVVDQELRKGSSANPFLAEFYVGQNGSVEHLPPEHVGVIYASMRARLSLGDSASLSVDHKEEEGDELQAEVEITLARRDVDAPRVLSFNSEQTGVMRLGPYVEDVEIDAPYGKVEIGPGPEAVLIAPVSIQCSELLIVAERLIAEANVGQSETSIYLDSESIHASHVTAVPTVRNNAQLSIHWPNSKAHPWTIFNSDPRISHDPRLAEILRRFRKFVIAFRSHSKGTLARYRHKLEHARMTKGSGQAVLDQMLSNKIVRLDGNMYYLDPNRLGSIAGASYADCMRQTFSEETLTFARKLL